MKRQTEEHKQHLSEALRRHWAMMSPEERKWKCWSELYAAEKRLFDIMRCMKSWNEIRKAATVFSKRWKGAYDEKSQALYAATVK